MLIDTRSESGNAYVILGLVRNILEQVGRLDEWPAIQADMKSSDHRHLCDVAERETHGTLQFDHHDND